MTLDAVSLAGLRTVAAAHRPETAVIARASAAVADGRGGWTTAPSTVATVSARVRAVRSDGRSDERLLGDRQTMERQWVIALPQGTDVRPQDIITISGRAYGVVSIQAPRSYEVERRVLCREVASV